MIDDLRGAVVALAAVVEDLGAVRSAADSPAVAEPAGRGNVRLRSRHCVKYATPLKVT